MKLVSRSTNEKIRLELEVKVMSDILSEFSMALVLSNTYHNVLRTVSMCEVMPLFLPEELPLIKKM